MIYEVTINQRFKYNETIVGRFTDLAEVQQFVETVIAHFEKVELNIAVLRDEDQGQEEADPE